VSLLALNARQRLSAIHHQRDNAEEENNDERNIDIADVNIMTSSATDMLTSQHPQSQSLPSIMLEKRHSKAEANDQSEPCQMIRQTLSITPAQEPDTVQSSDT